MIYHYFYKITNKIDGCFYYGVHSTKDLNDNYMGSGKKLRYMYKKYGIENFEKQFKVEINGWLDDKIKDDGYNEYSLNVYLSHSHLL